MEGGRSNIGADLVCLHEQIRKQTFRTAPPGKHLGCCCLSLRTRNGPLITSMPIAIPILHLVYKTRNYSIKIGEV